MKLLLTFFTIAFTFSSMFSQEYLEMIESNDHTVIEIIANAENYFADKDKGKGSGYKQFKRWEHDAVRMVQDNGYLKTVSQKIADLNAYNARLNETAGSRSLLNDNWEELGPLTIQTTSSWSPGVGRMTGISVDRTNTDHFITGGLNGGVWRTLDAGLTWTPLSDNFVNLDVNSVAIDPADSDIYYFGANGGLLYRSIDAGATWNEIAVIGAGNSAVTKILISPDDSNIMFSTVTGNGIFRSDDAGISWTNVTNDAFGFDVEFQPGNTSVVYASGVNFHKSIDGGLTFVETDIDGAGFAALMMGTSENNPDIVFALLANGDFRGLFKSTDGGDNFIELDHTGRNYMNADESGTGTGGQAPRDMDIVVHPDNADQVHIAGVNEWRSMDGGITFELNALWFLPDAIGLDVGYMHADVDYLEYVDGILYAATDGGVFRANNPTEPTSIAYYEDLNNGMGTQQFYKIAASQTEQVVVSGGTQDNGTTVYREATNDFVSWLGADGGGTGIDVTNSSRILGTLQFGTNFRSFNGGNTIGGGAGQTTGDGPFVTSLESDRVDGSTAYTVTNRVWRTTNFGASWTAASQIFSTTQLVSDVQVSASNNQILYASRGLSMFKTEDGGETDWIQTTGPGGVVNAIAIHPTDPDKVAVAVSGFTRLRVTMDGGDSWSTLNAGLPNFTALSVIWDDNNMDGLYLGMDFGVYYIDNTMDEFIPYNNLLPNVIVNDLDINNVTNTLYAGTFGRGLWASPLVEDGILSVDDFLSANDIVIAPNPVTNLFEITLPQTAQADIRIFNVQGALVKFEQDVFISGSHTIDVGSLQTGTYFVRINSDLGTVTKKILKN